jgi:hypothetical protein
VAWPSYLAPHSTEQTLYFDNTGLRVRHDYDVEISGGSNAAHNISEYVEVAGIRFPSKDRIFPRTLDEQSLAEPLIVSIDLREIAFTPGPGAPQRLTPTRRSGLPAGFSSVDRSQGQQ